MGERATLMSVLERRVHRTSRHMRICQVCHREDLYRVSRTKLERVLFTQTYECRACGGRSRVARRPVAGILRLFRSRYAVRTLNGLRSPKDS